MTCTTECNQLIITLNNPLLFDYYSKSSLVEKDTIFVQVLLSHRRYIAPKADKKMHKKITTVPLFTSHFWEAMVCFPQVVWSVWRWRCGIFYVTIKLLALACTDSSLYKSWDDIIELKNSLKFFHLHPTGPLPNVTHEYSCDQYIEIMQC